MSTNVRNVRKSTIGKMLSRWIFIPAVLIVLSSCDRPVTSPVVEPKQITIITNVHEIIAVGDTTAFLDWLYASPDINERSHDDASPLISAVRLGRDTYVHDLLDKGAERDLADRDGFTALHTAAQNGHAEIIRLLLSAGANPTLVDKDGLSPYDIAIMLGHAEAAGVLSDARAKFLAAPRTEPTPPAPATIEPALLLSTDFRTWTGMSGDRIDAAFIQNIFDTVILQSRDGEMLRIHLSRLSREDQALVRKLTGLDPHALASARTRVAQSARQKDSLGLKIGKEKGWTVLENCRLLKRSGNDGDSFHAQHDGKEYIFRLYFVDAAETSQSYPDRVRDQAKYFGLNTANTLKLGNEASKFSTSLLASAPFTAVTSWEDARGNSRLPRHYAIIVTPLGDLDELLTLEGLVRQYGMPVRGNAGQRKQSQLKKLEQEAKQNRNGAWRKIEAMAETR